MPMHWKCFPNKAMALPPLMPHRYEMCSCLQLTYYRIESKLLNNPIPLPTLTYLSPSLCMSSLSTLYSLLPLSFWSRGVVPAVVWVGRTESCTVTTDRAGPPQSHWTSGIVKERSYNWTSIFIYSLKKPLPKELRGTDERSFHKFGFNF